MRNGSASVIFGKAVSNKLAVWKITALWGFSEAAFGGILHAFQIPFTGLFVGGAAVLFISLIAYYSEDKGDILKSTIIVLIVKAMISPHSPITAYLAVSLQGILGEIFFYRKNFFKLSALLLGISVPLSSAFQKLIILTVVFGNTLWESIDTFSNVLLKQFSISGGNAVHFSILIISLYAGIHFIAGIIIGTAAGQLPEWINENKKQLDSTFKEEYTLPSNNKRSKKRPWWKRKSGILFFTFATITAALSYLHPGISDNKAVDILIMIIRSVVIMFVWYNWLSPILLKQFKKILNKKKSAYADDVNEIISLFPRLKTLLAGSWKLSAGFKGLKRIKYFITYAFIFILEDEFAGQQ